MKALLDPRSMEFGEVHIGEALDMGKQKELLPIPKLERVMAGDNKRYRKGKGKGKGKSPGKKAGGTFKRCYLSHPPLPLTEGLFVHGGSCGSPSVKDADIYIGFDHVMSKTNRRFPWETGEEVHLIIQDMSVPASPEQFKNLVVWAAKRIRKGKKVHAGCIGGHGRTGLFLAALVKHMMGIDDAITYVRENYCKKVVESQAQITFLEKHWGIAPVQPTKGAMTQVWKTTPGGKPVVGKPATGGSNTFMPVFDSNRNIWELS